MRARPNEKREQRPVVDPSSFVLHPSSPGTQSFVTAIEQQPRRRRYNVFVDGEFALALEPETLAGSKLAVGSPVAGTLLMELAAADLRKRALDAALRLLGYRPRSEQELRTRLMRRQLPPDVIGATIERLRELGFVNDEAFARAWVEERSSGRGARGQRLLTQELRRKGVGQELAQEAASGSDELAGAREAAEKKARSLRGLDYPTFRNRLAGYLGRRGFGYDVIAPVVRELWEAQGSGRGNDVEDEWAE